MRIQVQSLKSFENLKLTNLRVFKKLDCNSHSFDGHSNLTAFKYNVNKSPYSPLILSWLRKHSLAIDSNQVLGRLDRDVEDMLKWIDVENQGNLSELGK
jgi:hypothetical protein